MTPKATRRSSLSPRRAPLGIIGGSAFLESGELAGTKLRDVTTSRGPVTLRVGSDFVFLRRHGEGPYRHPHQISHHAHVLAFESLGVRKVAAFTSTGSLRAELRPGDVLVPDDYLSFHPPPTFATDDYLHIVPALDAEMRALLIAASQVRTSLSGVAQGKGKAPGTGSRGSRARRLLQREGVYAETRGPRFETAAEVRMLAPYAHVVGMTAASEATLFQERGIGYAMVCIVDNWAHGAGPETLTLEGFREHLRVSGALARAILGELLRLWRDREGRPRGKRKG
jgi:5'-methylthioadenosine phosphorylase